MMVSVCPSLLLTLTMVVAVTLPQVSTAEVIRHRRSDDGGPLEAVVQNLAQQVNQLKTEVAALQSKTSTLDKTVAFHAWCDAPTVQTVPRGVLHFKTVYTNVGHAYDPDTAVFAAPFTGLYDFQLTLQSRDAAGYMKAGIFVDTHLVAYAISDNRNSAQDNQQATSRAVVHVRAGSKVTVQNLDQVAKTFYGGQHSSFSGFLVKAD